MPYEKPEDLINDLKKKAAEETETYKGYTALFQYEEKKWWTYIKNAHGFKEHGAVGPKEELNDAKQAFRNWVDRRKAGFA